MTQPTPRDRIENLWDRATPVAPLLDVVVAESRADAFDQAAKAVLGRVEAYEGMGQDAVDRNRERSAIATELRRMAEEARS
ncbi:hypothetical protein ACFWV1_13065 [Streptomyces sp. NPDC058700]|uniref:hypothetical protein n=1 Tax=Streptomyces sp. NPDC058700 TaxID=3346607 RepID=UPI00364C6031